MVSGFPEVLPLVLVLVGLFPVVSQEQDPLLPKPPPKLSTRLLLGLVPGFLGLELVLGSQDLELALGSQDLELVQCLDPWLLQKLPNTEQGPLGPLEASGVSVE